MPGRKAVGFEEKGFPQTTEPLWDFPEASESKAEQTTGSRLLGTGPRTTSASRVEAGGGQPMEVAW